MNDWAIVVAAGRGTRFGANANKVYEPLQGRPVIVWSLQALASSDCFAGIVIVHAQGEDQQARLAADWIDLPVVLVQGGASRQESVAHGLAALPKDASFVAIHDGARPLISKDLICACMKQAHVHGAGIAASGVRDTLMRLDAEGHVLLAPQREGLFSVKTPQCFRVDHLKTSFASAMREGFVGTDDASVFAFGGFPIHLVPCTEDNIKITLTEDIAIATRLLGGENMIPRIGTGFDTHALVPGRKLILCGVEIPHDQGLMGHSDADVAVHALMDALLGACAMGDIGRIFPDTDQRFLGANSIDLLRQVVKLMQEKGWTPYNVDVTILAQRPKIAAYRQSMQECVANAMGLSLDFVNIKATTTEHLGFVGREEGIAAQAVASVLQREYYFSNTP